MFDISKNYYQVKTKNIRKIKKFYYSRNWIVLSPYDSFEVNHEIYNLHHNLDMANWRKQLNEIVINHKVLLIGKYHEIIPIYRFLANNHIIVYNIYINQ